MSATTASCPRLVRFTDWAVTATVNWLWAHWRSFTRLLWFLTWQMPKWYGKLHERFLVEQQTSIHVVVDDDRVLMSSVLKSKSLLKCIVLCCDMLKFL